MGIPLNIDWQQILLHLFNFVLLFGILYFLLYNPVKKFMDQRMDYYKKLDDEANENLKNAEAVKKEYLDKLAAADQEIMDKKEEAYQAFENVRTKKIKEAQEEADRIIFDARANGKKERDKMIDEAQTEIVNLVVNAAEKLSVNSVTADTYDLFLNTVKGSGKDA